MANLKTNLPEIKQMVDQVESDIERTVEAVYISGSTLNEINIRENDIDMYVFVEPQLHEIILGNRYSTELKYEFPAPSSGTIKLELKVMDVLKMVELLEKSNPNVLELFSRHAVYKSKFFEPIENSLFVQDEINLTQIDIKRFLASIIGQNKQFGKTIDRLVVEPMNIDLYRRLVKMGLNQLKFRTYIDQIIRYQRIDPDMSSNLKMVSIKKDLADLDVTELTFEQSIELIENSSDIFEFDFSEFKEQIDEMKVSSNSKDRLEKLIGEQYISNILKMGFVR